MSLYRSCRARDRSGQRERCIHGLWGHPLLLPQAQSRLCLHHGPEVGSCGRSWDLPWDKGPGCLFVCIMATASSCERLKQTPLPSGEDPLYGEGDGAFRKEGRGKEKCPWRTGFLWKEAHALAEALQGIFRVSKSVFGFRLASLQAHGESYSSVGYEMCPCPPCAHRARSCSYGWAQAHTVTEAVCVSACMRSCVCVRACAQLPRAHSAPDVSQGQAGWKG